MTRPVTEILEQAERENWPTSSIEAMANHHLCANRVRDYVNECFAGHAATREDGPGEARQGAVPLGREGAASAQSVQGDAVEADQNCPQCHGTGWRRPTPFEGTGDVRCNCS
jgi:hypothetical protein